MSPIPPLATRPLDAIMAVRSFAFDRLSAIAVVLDATGGIVDTNEAWRLFSRLNGGTAPETGLGANYLEVCDRAAWEGSEEAEAAATGVREILAGTRQRFDLEYPCSSPDEDRWFLLQAAAAPVFGATGAVVFHIDITARKLREERIVDAAELDALTGLPNRRGTIDLVDESLAAARGTDAPTWLLVLHVADLGVINARDGHHVGDELLVKIALRIRRTVRDLDWLCRAAGDEFVLICPALGKGEAEAISTRLRQVLAEPFQVSAATVSATVSVGAVAGHTGSTADSLLAEAERAALVDRGRRRPGAGRELAALAALAGPRGSRVESELSPSLARRLASPGHHRAVIEALGEGVLVQAVDGRVLFANATARDLLGRQEPDAALLEGWSIVGPDGQPITADDLPGRRALAAHAPIADEVIGLRDPTGATRWIEVSAHPIDAPGRPEPYAVVSTLRDLTRERANAARLRLQAKLLNAVGQAVVAWGTDGRITFLNDVAGRLYGWTSDQAVGRMIGEVATVDLPEEDLANLVATTGAGEPWQGEVLIQRRGDTPVPVWVTTTPVLDAGEVIGYIGLADDLTERKAADAVIAHQAAHDALTDLPNRRTLAQRIDRAGADPEGGGALILLDIGTLDVINEAYGHAIGDEALIRCAIVLDRAVDDGDLLARVSDHVFAVWCPARTDQARTAAEAARLGRVIAAPFNLWGIDLELRVSSAAALFGPEAAEGTELLRRADTALSQARRTGTTAVYDEDMRHQLLHRLQLELHVDRAVKSGRVPLGYQPIVRLDDQRVVGAEALLRLVDDAGRALPAMDVIAAAERSGRIGELGELILRAACLDAARWQRVDPERTIHVSVNLSARQLGDPSLPERVASALADAGLDPSALCLEVTESALMEDPVRSAALFADLKAQGIRLSADDFGTGYSSLAYLKTFPLDELKIDQSFVAGVPDNPEDVAITQAIVSMAQVLGLTVVAEGIETEAQLDGLLRTGAPYGQGWLWSRALPADEFEVWLRAQADRPDAPTGFLPTRGGRAAMPVASSEERIDSVLNELAHEIRSPLTVVTGYASMLDGIPGTEVAAAAIGRAALRIDRILADLVEVSTTDDAAVVAELAVADADELVARLVADLGPRAGGRLHVAANPTGGNLVRIDRGQVEQVLGNLVSNGLRFSPRGEVTELKVIGSVDWVEITVSDRGPGVEPQHLGLIFRKYGRVDSHRGGTGLGLYVARRIARSHGGDVRYRPRNPGPGSTFSLRLPRHHPAG